MPTQEEEDLIIEAQRPKPQNAPMVKYAEYHITTGAIKQTGTAFADSESADPEYAYYFGEVDQKTQYMDVATQEPIPRTASGITLDSASITLGQTATFSNVPVSCSFWVDDTGEVIVSDGVLTLTPQSVGEYFICLQEARFLPQNWTITVDNP